MLRPYDVISTDLQGTPLTRQYKAVRGGVTFVITNSFLLLLPMFGPRLGGGNWESPGFCHINSVRGAWASELYLFWAVKIKGLDQYVMLGMRLWWGQSFS